MGGSPEGSSRNKIYIGGRVTAIGLHGQGQRYDEAGVRPWRGFRRRLPAGKNRQEWGQKQEKIRSTHKATPMASNLFMV